MKQQRAVIRFLVAEVEKASKILQRQQVVYGDVEAKV